MTYDEYLNVVNTYTEMISACMGIPEQVKAYREAQLKFISHASFTPTYTMKASWLIEEGKGLEADRVIHLHPYEFCRQYGYLTKDYNGALDQLKKYVHEWIDRH